MKPQLTALLMVFSLCINAQKSDTLLFDPSGYKPEEKIALPFSALQIVDARFDRSNVGCLHKKIKKGRIAYERVPALLPDSLHLFLPKLMDKLVTYSPSGDTLVVLLKQFRIVEHLINRQTDAYEPQLLLKVSASFFRSRKDSFVRLFSLDDLISVKWPNDLMPEKEVVEEHRPKAFMTSLRVVLNQRSWQKNGVAFTKKSVEEGLRKRFQLPLFTDTALKTGIYKTFAEFKNNAPSTQGIKVRMSKAAPSEVTDASGKAIDLKACWGLCAEGKRFIFFRGKFYALLPSDRSFRFLSYTQTKDLYGQPSFGGYAPQTGVLPALLAKVTDNDVNRQYFYLNMDEEEIYLEEVFGKSGLKILQKDLLK